MTFPTLIVYGKADSSYTGEAVAQHLHEVLSNSTLVQMEQSGHWPYLEEPQRFEEVLHEFLTE